MDVMLSALVRCLDNAARAGADVIPWSSPIPSFGNLSRSRVATLGLNPSNREFVDGAGNELHGRNRRFHTLSSLGLDRWSEANANHLQLMVDSCAAYFHRNPYDGWFRRLDQIVSGTQASYYDAVAQACHLDLIPFATACKWTALTSGQRQHLLEVSGDTLGLLLRDSPIRVLILNGSAVVAQFQEIAGIRLERQAMANWSLPRHPRPGVTGISFKGTIEDMVGIRLDQKILVLGFNHNIQISFGVTTDVISAIRDWVAQSAGDFLA